MPHACSRKNGSAPIQELLASKLGKKELAFIYLGYAGILLRSRERVLAFDAGPECLRQGEIEALKTLDVQFYSHTHWDHWGPDITSQVFETTGATVVAEPEVVEEMRDRIPSDALRAATPGRPLIIDGLEVSAITGVHPRPITIFRVRYGELSVFHGADSGYVPLSAYPADVAFVPTGTPSPSCSPKNALLMVLDVQPKVAVAMHGNPRQLQEYQRLVQKEMPRTQVVIPEPCELVRIDL